MAKKEEWVKNGALTLMFLFFVGFLFFNIPIGTESVSISDSDRISEIDSIPKPNPEINPDSTPDPELIPNPDPPVFKPISKPPPPNPDLPKRKQVEYEANQITNRASNIGAEINKILEYLHRVEERIKNTTQTSKNNINQAKGKLNELQKQKLQRTPNSEYSVSRNRSRTSEDGNKKNTAYTHNTRCELHTGNAQEKIKEIEMREVIVGTIKLRIANKLTY